MVDAGERTASGGRGPAPDAGEASPSAATAGDRRADGVASGGAAAPPAEADRDLAPLGAHVSIAGGLPKAVERAETLGATALQVFTTQPQRWAERELDEDEAASFRRALRESGVRTTAAHDSYLINLASEKPDLRRKSRAAFRGELERCTRLGIDVLVTHPGNATGGDREAALRRNARTLAEVLDEVPGATRVLLETTAGSGTALGWRFDELAELLERIPPGQRARTGVCLDTAHVFAAGHDLRNDFDGVLDAFDRTVGLERLRLLHLNDSKAALGSRTDRHAHIGDGELGEEVFRRVMRDERLEGVPRVLETPKDDDAMEADRRNLETLRRLRTG